ncbi:hypothetical protein ACFX2I_029939 [Malus domestica]
MELIVQSTDLPSTPREWGIWDSITQSKKLRPPVHLRPSRPLVCNHRPQKTATPPCTAGSRNHRTLLSPTSSSSTASTSTQYGSSLISDNLKLGRREFTSTEDPTVLSFRFEDSRPGNGPRKVAAIVRMLPCTLEGLYNGATKKLKISRDVLGDSGSSSLSRS